MGVLCVMPTWNAPSELWLQRMLNELRPHLSMVAAYAPNARVWGGDVQVVPLESEEPSLWFRAARHLGVPVRPHRPRNRALRKAVDSADVSAVLVNYLTTAVDLADVWAESGKRLFVHCHGYDTTWDLHDHLMGQIPRFGTDYIQSVRQLSERATIIANSATTERRLLEAGVSASRVVMKYIGVPVPDAPPESRRSGSPVTVLYLGRLVDCKGPDLVIAAFDVACSAGMQGRLVIAGDGPLRTTCELMRHRSRYRDRIDLLGAVDAPTAANLLRQADIFTAHNCVGPLSRQEEALGVSVLEAMAAGLPVVSGRSGGLCETVVDGRTGFLVEPGDVEGHAQALVRLAADPELRRAMGLAGWERVRDNFSEQRERAELHRILGLAA